MYLIANVSHHTRLDVPSILSYVSMFSSSHPMYHKPCIQLGNRLQKVRRMSEISRHQGYGSLLDDALVSRVVAGKALPVVGGMAEKDEEGQTASNQ